MKGCDEVPMFIYKEVLMSAILGQNVATMNLKHHLHTKMGLEKEG
jgi:hypothetical protein